ncbi:MAG: hypothetical protein Q7R30_00500 [Acidobacteriota bacterium]|nr:hypothetical protein [Acidobacteriota bacterium]
MHVHAFAFAGLTLSEAVKFSRIDAVQAVVGYGLRAAAIGFIYLVASIPASVIILAWAAIAS